MLRLATLLVFGSAIALGQSRLELLQKVADHYKNSDTFRVEGTASAMIPGTSWRGMYEFKTEAAQPDFLPLNLRGPSIRESTLVHKASLVQTKENATDSKPKAEFGMVPFGRYVELTRRLVDAQKVGEETITVGGKTYACELIDVT